MFGIVEPQALLLSIVAMQPQVYEISVQCEIPLKDKEL